MTALKTPPPWATLLADNCWRLYIHVQPGAKKSEIAGETDGRLRVRIAAQAVDNKANKALTEFIAKCLGVRQSRVTLESGLASRKKTLKIANMAEPNWSAFSVSDVPS